MECRESKLAVVVKSVTRAEKTKGNPHITVDGTFFDECYNNPTVFRLQVWKEEIKCVVDDHDSDAFELSQFGDDLTAMSYKDMLGFALMTYELFRS